MTPFLALAHAADVLVYENDFDAYTTSDFSGTDGWESGYWGDDWSTRTGDDVYATTDDGEGTWGSGSSIDNHLVYTGDGWADFTASATMRVSDDDAAGFVFRFEDASNFYMAVFCNGSFCPGPDDGSNDAFTGARLYRVQRGRATQLDDASAHYTYGVEHAVEIVTSGSDLEVWFDDDANGVMEAADLVLTATDTAFTEGNLGFYTYNCGERQSGGCAFDDLVVTTPVATDDDNDGHDASTDGGDDCDDTDATVYPGATELADGIDNDCDGVVDEGTAAYDDDGDGYTEQQNDCDDGDGAVSPAAEEVAGNGIDDDCDGDVDESAPADDTGGGGGDDTGRPPEDTSAVEEIGPREVRTGDLVTAAGDCGCAAGGGAAGWLASAIALAFARRRPTR